MMTAVIKTAPVSRKRGRKGGDYKIFTSLSQPDLAVAHASHSYPSSSLPPSLPSSLLTNHEAKEQDGRLDQVKACRGPMEQ